MFIKSFKFYCANLLPVKFHAVQADRSKTKGKFSLLWLKYAEILKKAKNG
ncbi:hypothetical protein [uncultured Campylobacter sp.]|jgi:hypothetical protein|nr:hypothetical protein [uncultured Campylobacter sp.]